MRRLLAVAGLALMAACAPKKPVAPAVPAGPTPAQRATTAEAMVRAGCFDCLVDALREFEAARTAASAAPATVEAATAGAIRTAILLELRQRELGLLDGGYLARARELLNGREDLAAAFGVPIDVALSTPSRFFDPRNLIDPAQSAAIRRAGQNHDAWRDALRAKAGEDPFSAYIWLTFACNIGAVRSLSPDDLAATVAAVGPAPLLSYKTAMCPGTKDVPPKQAAIDVDTLEALRAGDPRFVEIDYTLGNSLVFSGRIDEASALIGQAYKWHPKWPSALMSLAGLAVTGEEYDHALVYYDGLLELVPGHPEAMLGRVKMLGFVGKNEEAIRAVDEMLQERWNRGEAYYWRAWNNMQLARNDQAWEDVQAAEKLWLKSDVLKLAGMIAYRRKEIDVARQKFEAGHKMNADDCELGHYLGLVAAEQGRWQQAADVFPPNVDCLQHYQQDQRAEIGFIQGSSATAERKARQIARREKLIQEAERMIATSWYNAAVAFYNLSRPADARSYAQKVVDDEQFGERAKEILTRLK